jgi:hypothetical protein
VVLCELGLSRSLTSSEDTEVGTAFGSLELSGSEGFGGEVSDLASGAEFEGGVFGGERGDAGLAGFEGLPEGGW